MTSLNPGDVFAGYTIERELGAGGMGEVYLVRHPRLPGSRRSGSRTTSVRGSPVSQALRAGGRCCCALRHPSIVRVLDRGEADGRLWISWNTSTATTSANTSVPIRCPGHHRPHHRADRARIGRRRPHGLTHRDVKPANILLDTDGQALLVDFGIAHANDQNTVLTGTGIALGTVAFAAPEQLQGLDVDSRTDQYALGCTAFALLTGTHVYVGNSAAAIAIAHVKDPIRLPPNDAPGGCRPPWTRC